MLLLMQPGNYTVSIALNSGYAMCIDTRVACDGMLGLALTVDGRRAQEQSRCTPSRRPWQSLHVQLPRLR